MPLEALGWSEAWQRAYDAHAPNGCCPGRIVSEHRSHFQVAVEDDEIAAELPGRMWQNVEVRSDLPGVGDFVAVRTNQGDGPAVIEVLLPRRTALIRRAAGERRPQLIAANVDVVMIVTTADGDFSADRIERYLQVVRDGGARPVIVVNKADLGKNGSSLAAEVAAVAGEVPTHFLCAHDEADLSVLESYFDEGQTVGLVGSSGVGKSTLTNQLLGRDAQQTQPVSVHDNRGRHTTTHRELFARPGGGSVMDTPGMGGLVIWEEEEAAIVDDFADIEALAAQCKFRNCAHQTEPACEVRDAIDRGELSKARFEIFRAQQ